MRRPSRHQRYIEKFIYLNILGFLNVLDLMTVGFEEEGLVYIGTSEHPVVGVISPFRVPLWFNWSNLANSTGGFDAKGFVYSASCWCPSRHFE